MKIIHTADIHLDSALTSNLSGDKRKERKNELLQTFKRMVEFAKKESVKAIIIAGDFFDAKKISAKTKSVVYGIIKSYSDIDFLYLCGNHDEALTLVSDNELPENLKLFSDSVTTYEYGDITVSGVQLTPENYHFVYDDIKLKALKTNIFVLHGEVSKTNSTTHYEKIPLKKLEDKYINYLALGHYHSYETGVIDKNGIYAYSGCLEGRGFDETGQKGFVLIDVTDGTLKHNFVPFAYRTIYDIDINITDNTSHLQLENVIKQGLLDYDNNSIIRVNLVGEVLVNEKIDINYVQTLFENEYYYITFKDKTKLKINVSDYENDISLRGEFIRMVNDSNLSTELKQQIILTGVSALLGEEV